MSDHVKILELNSNLSKLIDSLCFQLAVNYPDSNSLSLIEIIDWKNNDQINHDQFRQLYTGWLQSKNIQDFFKEKQIKTYPKEQLIQFQGPIKRQLTVNQITKTLQLLNALYNEMYIQKKLQNKNTSKQQIIKRIQEVQKLFSILDTNGVINLRMNQIFFLTISILIGQNKPVSTNFDYFKQNMRKFMKQISQINGTVSLRAFKNYFLQSKGKIDNLKTIINILTQIQTICLSNQIGFDKKKSLNISLPQILDESIEKWKNNQRFKNKQKKVQFLKRIFEENQNFLYFNNELRNNLFNELLEKYGKQLLDCLQVDQQIINQFLVLHNNTINKYLSLVQKIPTVNHLNQAHQSSSNLKNGKTPKYIDQASSLNYIPPPNTFDNSIKKKISAGSQFGTATKNLSKTPTKDRTPQKIRKNNHDYTVPNNYKNRTPNNKAYTEISQQFGGSAEKKNLSGYIVSGRQTTPTKSNLSFVTDIPRTYRAAQKKGLQQNNVYDKLFFFRNKRVQSYQIVMKRLKNK